VFRRQTQRTLHAVTALQRSVTAQKSLTQIGDQTEDDPEMLQK